MKIDLDLPYLMHDKDRHGTARLYVRRFKRKIRMTEEPGTPAFMLAYNAAVAALAPRPLASSPRAQPAAKGTLGWLATLYFDSDEFRALADGTSRRAVIESCLQEPVRPDTEDTFRDCPLEYITPKKIKRLRDLKTGLPGAANNRRKYLSAMFGWGVENEHATANPVRDVRRVKYATTGFHTWTIAEIELARANWPIGTRERLALEMLLFIGVRRGDFVRLGPQHDTGTAFRFTPRKTRKRKPEAIDVPISPYLRMVLDATKLGALAYFMTEQGKPFTAAGFGNWFGERCEKLGLPGRAHGLRKGGATIAAEEGATVIQLMAMYCWSTEKQAIAYVRAANQKKLAEQNSKLLETGMKGGAL